MGILHELQHLIISWFEDLSAEPGFRSGVIAGAVGFVIIAYIVFKVQVWWGNITAPFKPLKVTHTTSSTPAQVMGSSCRSLLVGLLVIACVLCVLFGILFPETCERMLQALGRRF